MIVKLAGGLDKFLQAKYPKKFVLITFGHVELITKGIMQEYLEWHKKEYLKETEDYEGKNRTQKQD